MRSVVVTQTGAGTSNWVLIDDYKNPVNVGIACVHSGTVVYTVEYTFDDFENSAITVTAWPHATITGESSADANGSILFPVKGVRVNVASGTGSVTMTVIQSGGGIN